jgi:hypothetical protein
MIILVAILGFVTLGGLGYVVAGAGTPDPRITKRARAIAAPRVVEKYSCCRP